MQMILLMMLQFSISTQHTRVLKVETSDKLNIKTFNLKLSAILNDNTATNSMSL
jgi:hypothetical protein